jgi:Protein of unknown function (DUF3486)
MAGKRNNISTVKKLPPDVVAEIDKLRIQHGWEIDELVEFVRSKGGNVSRSAMHRYTQKLHDSVEAAAEKLNRSNSIGKALVERFGDQPDNELARLNIQLLQGQVLDMIVQEEAAELDDEGNPLPVMGDSLKLVRLTKAVQQLLSAEKMNAERVAQIRRLAVEEERQRIKAAMQEAVDSGGEDAEIMERARRRLGFD